MILHRRLCPSAGTVACLQFLFEGKVSPGLRKQPPPSLARFPSASSRKQRADNCAPLAEEGTWEGLRQASPPSRGGCGLGLLAGSGFWEEVPSGS